VFLENMRVTCGSPEENDAPSRGSDATTDLNAPPG
jgi:hypothetical protein